MTTVRTNILANLAGQGWSALLQLLLLPFYLHFLGIEAYGIVSLYVVLMTTVQIFDLGLAQTLNRELARWRGMPQRTAQIRDLVRTIEIVYWVIVLLVCTGVLTLAFFFAAQFLQPRHLDASTITKVAMMMAVVVALQWPVTLYQSGLMGLQHQLSANVLRVALSTVTGVGAVAMLWLVSATLTAFFAWQIIAAFIAVASTAHALHRRLPPAAATPRFRPQLLRPIWRFAAGVSALTISAIILTQADKWILVSLLPLDTFGYYSLAWSAANALGLLTAPVFAAIYPRFSTLVAQQNHRALYDLYHLATQAISLSAIPAAILLSFFSEEVLLLWTQQESVAHHSAPILSVLAIGSLLNALAHPPYAWELAHGRTGVFLTFNWIAIVIALPAIWHLSAHYGGMGAAMIWAVLNAAYFVAAVPLIHRNLPREEQRRWLVNDVALPMTISVSVVGISRALFPSDLGKIETFLALVLVLMLAASLALHAAPPMRALLADMVSRARRRSAP